MSRKTLLRYGNGVVLGFFVMGLIPILGCTKSSLPVTRSDADSPLDMHRYDFPDVNEVRGILVYADWNLAEGFSLDGNQLGLVVGDRIELQKILRLKLRPTMMVDDPAAVRRISEAYASALAEHRKKAMKDTRGGTHFLISTTLRIAFITKGRIYLRDFTIDDTDMVIFEPWMESKELWVEFKKIGYLKKTSADPNTK
jgi:hypothetical protein